MAAPQGMPAFEARCSREHPSRLTAAPARCPNCGTFQEFCLTDAMCPTQAIEKDKASRAQSLELPIVKSRLTNPQRGILHRVKAAAISVTGRP